MNLKELTSELKIEEIDQIIGGLWTTDVNGVIMSSGSDDWYGIEYHGWRIGFYHTWT